MDRNIATEIADLADNAISRAERSRKRLAADIAVENGNLATHSIRNVLTAQAQAKPWRAVLTLIEKGKDPVEAVRTVRASVFQHLVRVSEMSSTDGIANENDRIERDGGRTFLLDVQDLPGIEA